MDIEIDIQGFIDSMNGLREQDIAWLYQYKRYIFLTKGQSKLKSIRCH